MLVGMTWMLVGASDARRRAFPTRVSRATVAASSRNSGREAHHTTPAASFCRSSAEPPSVAGRPLEAVRGSGAGCATTAVAVPVHYVRRATTATQPLPSVADMEQSRSNSGAATAASPAVGAPPNADTGSTPIGTVRRRVPVVGIGVAACGLLVLGVLTGVIPLPDLGALLRNLSDVLGTWTYALVPALAFLETAALLGLLVPGETAVLVGGVVAERGAISLPLIGALVWAAAATGDLVAFLLGRRLGRPFLHRHAGSLRVNAEHLDQVERLFDRHGGKIVLGGRFVGVLRAFTPFVAGTTDMRLRTFVPYSVGAALLWAAAFTIAGYLLSDAIDTVGSVITKVTLAATALAAVGLWLGKNRIMRPEAPVAGKSLSCLG